MDKPDGPDELSRDILQELREAEASIVRGETFLSSQEVLECLNKAKEALKSAIYMLIKEWNIPPEPDPQPEKTTYRKKHD